MKKIFILCFSAALCGLVSAQTGTMYAAAKAGLSIRETADAKGKVLDKVPYGEKVTVAPTDTAVNISTEGFSGLWIKATYKGKSGYVVNTYLFPTAPPKATVKTIEAYLAQVSSPAGASVSTTTSTPGLVATENAEFSSHLKKQLYKNGAEHHNYSSYEYGSDIYFLPGFSIQQGFQLVRLLKLFPEVIPENEPFPKKDSKKTMKNGERNIKVEYEPWGDTPAMKKLRFEWDEGASYFLEIYQMDDQLIIYTGSGV